MKATLGKVLYGLLFCALLPALLVAWARLLATRLPAMPAAWPPGTGWLLVGVGGALLARGMRDLWIGGGGLPMNPYPPPRYVATGIYQWVPHPIYLGFALLMPGVLAVAGLHAGCWVISPVIWLGTLALVAGYERIDLRRRFGAELHTPRVALPPDEEILPRWWHRASAYLLVLLPWGAVQLAVMRLLDGRPGTETYLPWEYTGTPLPAAAALYVAGLAGVALAPLVAPTQSSLRRFVRDGWAGGGFLLWCHLVLPLRAAPRLPAAALPGPLAPWIPDDSPSAWAAFPAAHAFWILLAARLYDHRLPVPVVRFLAVILAASAVMAGRNSLLAVLAGAGVSAAVSRLDDHWRALLRATERVANSWRDWRLGPVRIINHGGYVAAAAGAGLWLVGFLLGGDHAAPAVLVATCGLLGAGIWAQWLESSSGLSRPFGYYGGIFGGCAGVLAAQLWRGDGWLLLGGFAVASPLVQGLGRLRCLVQGCCHGRPCEEHLGIRYQRPLSRVCKMTSWGGRPVYPTPLYSLLGNLLILGLVLRLWCAGAELGFIAGTYLITAACARFVEEGYRGEPQTARLGGLAIYQWLALLFVLGGIGFTAIPTAAAPPVAGTAASPLAYAVPFGLVVWFAMGVDFPESRRRFSRLA